MNILFIAQMNIYLQPLDLHNGPQRRRRKRGQEVDHGKAIKRLDPAGCHGGRTSFVWLESETTGLYLNHYFGSSRIHYTLVLTVLFFFSPKFLEGPPFSWTANKADTYT